MSAHTSGPWLREGSFVYALMSDGFKRGEEQFKNRFYFQVNRDHADCSQEECEAVAALAQAAPDLLSVLEHASRLNSFREFNDYLPTIRAAISKATGASK